MVLRLIDNGIMIGVVTLFVFISFDCEQFGCSSQATEDAWNVRIIGMCYIVMRVVLVFASSSNLPSTHTDSFLFV